MSNFNHKIESIDWLEAMKEEQENQRKEYKKQKKAFKPILKEFSKTNDIDLEKIVNASVRKFKIKIL